MVEEAAKDGAMPETAASDVIVDGGLESAQNKPCRSRNTSAWSKETFSVRAMLTASAASRAMRSA